jgi:hypothetical protein
LLESPGKPGLFFFKGAQYALKMNLQSLQRGWIKALRNEKIEKIWREKSLKGWGKRGEQYAGITQVFKRRVNEG